jgi:A/G-specific adenine glycosylase
LTDFQIHLEMPFTDEIIAWYNQNKRDLPWRNINNPYFIWISEVILQQTRVEQGRSYFHKFTEAYPTIAEMAAAHEDEILKKWQGLGYYSRARNMHFAAKTVVNEYNGIFPNDYNEIIKLKGVGGYTAAAIASFAFNAAQPVVDGNVYRLLSRYFGITTPIDSNEGKKQFLALAEDLIDKQNPGLFNQAIMEFGALQCKPGLPDCSVCPLVQSCEAYNKGLIAQLPIKSKKIKPRDRFFNYLFITYKDTVYIHRREGKDIWTGLYDFPLIETDKAIAFEELAVNDTMKTILDKGFNSIDLWAKEYKHQLTHQTIYAKFYTVNINIPLNADSNNYIAVNNADLHGYGIPRLIDLFLKDIGLLK